MSPEVARANADAAATLVGALVDGGVRAFVLSPGSRSTPLALALAALEASGRVSVVVAVDERVAAFIALGLSLPKRAPVALVCTSGSAGAHYLPALVEARRTGAPLIALTADRPPELHGCGAPQTIEQARLFGAHAVHFCDPGPPTEGGARVWGRAAVDALRAATDRPGGPAHLNLPFREPLWSEGLQGIAEQVARRVWGAAPTSTFTWPADIVDRIERAQRPLIVCGAARPHGEMQAAVVALSEAWGAPVLAEPISQLRFSGRHAAVLSSGETLLRSAGFMAAHAPDLIVRVGGTPTTRAGQSFVAGCGALQLGVSLDGLRADPADRLAAWCDGEPIAALRSLQRIAPAVDPSSAWSRAWIDADRAASEALRASVLGEFWSGSIMASVAQRLADADALFVASSMAVRDLDAFAPRRDVDVHVYANRGANGIDGTIATALGVAKASGRRVVVLLGDVAFQHDVGALVAARGAGVDLTLVVTDNGGGAIFGYLPIASQTPHFDRYFLTPPEADISALARAAGATVHACDSTETLGRALDAARAAPGLHVVHARVDRAVDAAEHRAAFGAATAAVEATLTSTTHFNSGATS